MGDTEAHSRNWTSMKIVKQRSVKIDLFLSAIELSVVLFTASDYPFDTLKLFYIKANAKRFNNQIKKKWAFSLNIIEHAGIMNTWMGKHVDTLITSIKKQLCLTDLLHNVATFISISCWWPDKIFVTQITSHRWYHTIYVKSSRICPKVIRIGPCNFRTCILYTYK